MAAQRPRLETEEVGRGQLLGCITSNGQAVKVQLAAQAVEEGGLEQPHHVMRTGIWLSAGLLDAKASFE